MAVVNFCPSCGSPQDAGTNFCAGCGFKLDSLNVPPPTSSPPTPDQAGSDANFLTNFTQCLAAKHYVIDTSMYATPAIAVATLAVLSKQVVAFLLKEGVKELGKDEIVALVASQAIPVLDMAVDTGIAAAFTTLTVVELGKYVVEKFPAILAVFDCATRFGIPLSSLPYGLEAMNLMNSYLSPPVPLAPPMHEQLPVQLPPPPPTWSPMVVPPPPTKKAGMSAGNKVAAVVGITTLGVLGALWLGSSLPNNNINNNVPVPVPVASVSVGQVGASTCKQTIHGGYVYEWSCTGSVDVVIPKDISSGYITVFMTVPWTTDVLHGSVSVPSGFRGTITVPTTITSIKQGCTAYSNSPSTITVYNGNIYNGASGSAGAPQLATDNRSITWNCS